MLYRYEPTHYNIYIRLREIREMEKLSFENVELLLNEVVKLCYEDNGKVDKVIIELLESNDLQKQMHGLSLIQPIIAELLK